MNVHACSFASARFTRQQSLQSAALKDVGLAANRIHACGDDMLAGKFDEKVPQADESNRYGYFSFKPYLLEKVLLKIPYGDILMYLDVNDRPRCGIIEYVQMQFVSRTELNILSAGTNYLNARYMSWYHRENLAAELLVTSHFICQPEAGFVAIRNTKESQALLRVWFELTLVQALALMKRNDLASRHDQETLFLLSRLNKSVQVDSWWKFKLTGEGIRKYVDWEAFR